MAQRYRVRVTERAKASLDRITEYLEEYAGYEVAVKVRSGILDAIDGLEEMPHRYGIVQEISSEQEIYRRVLKWSYRIIYTIDESDIEVLVVEINHRSQDPQKMIDQFS